MEERRVVITKDTDFYNGYLIHGEPFKLLFVTTGNVSNAQLEALFAANLPDLVRLPSQHEVVEISKQAIIVHV